MILYNSVEEMLNDLDINEGFITNLKLEIDSHRLSKIFFSYRCFQNLTQYQMAEKLGCTLEELQDLEDSTDMEIYTKYGRLI